MIAVVADGFHGAAFLGLFALGLFLRCGWLFVDVGIAALIVAAEIVGCGFATEVAVDALIVHVVFARDVVRILVCFVCHSGSPFFPVGPCIEEAGPDGKPQRASGAVALRGWRCSVALEALRLGVL